MTHSTQGAALTRIAPRLCAGRLGEAGAPLHPRISRQLDNHFAYMNAFLHT